MRATRISRAISLFLALTLIFCAGCSGDGNEDSPDSPEVDDGGEDWNSTISYNGVKYKRRNDLRTVLFLGVDNTDTSPGAAGALGNNGRADAIMLFILDNTNKTTQVLMISRDTMTEVDIYDGAGNFSFSGQSQINMQYAYGNSAMRSCFLMKRTVSELLYGVRIDYHFALTMDGIATIVDTMGGITLTMPEDFTYIDSRCKAGAVVTFDGAEAERFIRYRDTSDRGSNEQRVERQSWFMHAIFNSMRDGGNMSNTLDEILEAADPYIETNLDGDTIDKLASFNMAPDSMKVPGEVYAGEAHDEYYVDELALQELIINIFYAPEE